MFLGLCCPCTDLSIALMNLSMNLIVLEDNTNELWKAFYFRYVVNVIVVVSAGGGVVVVVGGGVVGVVGVVGVLVVDINMCLCYVCRISIYIYIYTYISTMSIWSCKVTCMLTNAFILWSMAR